MDLPVGIQPYNAPIYGVGASAISTARVAHFLGNLFRRVINCQLLCRIGWRPLRWDYGATLEPVRRNLPCAHRAAESIPIRRWRPVERAGPFFSGRDYRHDPRAGNVDRQPVPRENRACFRWMFVQNCAFRAQGSAHQCTVCRRAFRSPHLRAR